MDDKFNGVNSLCLGKVRGKWFPCSFFRPWNGISGQKGPYSYGFRNYWANDKCIGTCCLHFCINSFLTFLNPNCRSVPQSHLPQLLHLLVSQSSTAMIFTLVYVIVAQGIRHLQLWPFWVGLLFRHHLFWISGRWHPSHVIEGSKGFFPIRFLVEFLKVVFGCFIIFCIRMIDFPYGIISFAHHN